MDEPWLTPNAHEQALLQELLRAIRKVKHGYVQVIVQDARVIQVDILEKRRLDRPRD